MSTLKRFAGQTAVYGLSSIGVRVLGFFLTPLYVHYYSTSQYGVQSELFAWTTLINPILTFGMETTYFRFLNKEKNNPEVFNDSFLTLLGTSVLFLLLGLFNINLIEAYLQRNVSHATVDYHPFIQMLFGIIVLDNITVIPFAKLRAEGRPGKYALAKCSNILLFIVLNLFFIFIYPKMAVSGTSLGHFLSAYNKGRWVGYIFVSNVIASLSTFLLLLPEMSSFSWKFNFNLLKQMLLYSWPIMIANISFTINENLDKIYLKALLPEGQNLIQLGIYSACYKLAVFLNIFIQAFRLGAEPFFFSHAAHPDSKRTYATIMNYFIIIVAVIFLGIVTNIEWLKYFIPNRNYWTGLKIVPIILAGYVCLGIYMNLSIWYKLSDQTKYGFYISGAGAIITIIMNPLLIPVMGYMGSAWTTFAAYFVMMVCSYLWGQKHFPIPYDLKKSGSILLGSLLLVALSFIVFKRNLLIGNFLLLIFVAIIFFLEKNNFLRLIKKKA